MISGDFQFLGTLLGKVQQSLAFHESEVFLLVAHSSVCRDAGGGSDLDLRFGGAGFGANQRAILGTWRVTRLASVLKHVGGVRASLELPAFLDGK